MTKPLNRLDQHSRFLALGAVCLIAGSCTTSVDSNSASSETSLAGVIYHLSTTQLTTEITYELAGCKQGDKIHLIDIKVSSQAVPDRSPDATYAINTKKLSNWLKTVDVARVELDDGRLTKISYDAADHSGEVIASVAKTVASFGIPGAPVALGAIVGSGESTRNFQALLSCNEATRRAADERAYLERLMVDMAKRREKLYDGFLEGKEDFGSKIDDLEARIAKVEASLESLVSEKLRATYVKHWTPTWPKSRNSGAIQQRVEGSQKQNISIEVIPDAIVVLPWFRQPFKINPKDNSPNEGPAKVGGPNQGDRAAQAIDNSIEEALDLILKPSVLKITLTPNRNSEAYGIMAEGGVKYRIPASVSIKMESPYLGELKMGTAEFLQFGPIATLNFENRAFQDNKLEVTFDTNGALNVYEYVESASRLKALTNAADMASRSVLSAEKTSLDRQKEILDARKAVLESEAALKKATEDAKSKRDDSP